MRKISKKGKEVDWYDAYSAIIRMMPEMAFTHVDEHSGSEWDCKQRYFNKWKKERIQKMAKDKTFGAGALFLLKLDLAMLERKYSGVKTPQEALNYILKK